MLLFIYRSIFCAVTVQVYFLTFSFCGIILLLMAHEIHYGLCFMSYLRNPLHLQIVTMVWNAIYLGLDIYTFNHLGFIIIIIIWGLPWWLRQ